MLLSSRLLLRGLNEADLNSRYVSWLNDLDAMKHSYHSFAPSSAPLYTKNIADTVTSAVGGSGVIFEVANFVLNNLYKHDLKCD